MPPLDMSSMGGHSYLPPSPTASITEDDHHDHVHEFGPSPHQHHVDTRTGGTTNTTKTSSTSPKTPLTNRTNYFSSHHHETTSRIQKQQQQHQQQQHQQHQRKQDDPLANSLQAVLVTLQRHGLSAHSIQELQTCLAAGKYLSVMERAQEYAAVILAASTAQREQPERDHRPALQQRRARERAAAEVRAGMFLIVAAWESLVQWQAVLYKRAHRHFHRVRKLAHSCTGISSSNTGNQSTEPAATPSSSSFISSSLSLSSPLPLQSHYYRTPLSSSALSSSSTSTSPLDEALREQENLAEALCAAQKGWIQAKMWEQRHDSYYLQREQEDQEE